MKRFLINHTNVIFFHQQFRKFANISHLGVRVYAEMLLYQASSL